MQVERETDLDSLGMKRLVESGERVSNAWVIYPEVGDNPPKGGLIPHTVSSGRKLERKGGLCLKLSLQDEPASY